MWVLGLKGFIIDFRPFASKVNFCKNPHLRTTIFRNLATQFLQFGVVQIG